MATITFHGAAQEVTGSCHLLESPAIGRVLLDCGVRQGGDAVERVQEETFAFDPASIDAVILSHAHLDHSGMLPLLVNQGFSGTIYCTQASKGLLRILLEDASGLYHRDLEHENLRRQRSGRPALVEEYSDQDVKNVIKLCSTAPYHSAVQITPDATLTFHDAGHILGSAIVELTLNEKGQTRRLVFSGDLGKTDSVLMNDPEQLHSADVLMMEGTYGDRDHRTLEDTVEQLEKVLHDTWERGGNVLIPAFAVGRSQEILFHLGCLQQQGRLDNWQVFLDSPMAIEVTQVYDHWLHLLDDTDVRCLTDSGRESLAEFLPTLKMCQSSEESMTINKIKQGAIIIAGSGMCTGGRIRHHFKHRIWREETTLLFIGFQARGTLGRRLVDGEKKIRLFGDEFVVRARIETMGGFSAHAGQSELINWAKGFNPAPKLVLVHGEAQALEALSQKLWTEHSIRSEIPALGHSIAF
ncbi:MAG: MBL fold metallo-hydrolase [Gammaproteobacteria bacterium]|nr:MBL fold metallo-hydrolase [Gammaproteobacteria bacterium]MDP2347596.1 MBL fold metallo-hydrolase [Gammaproteobacteria bacterium]